MKLYEIKPKPVLLGFGSSISLALKGNHLKRELVAAPHSIMRK